ncbi:MAG: glycosyltransferase family A protein [Spirochaetales bacterium]|nr:glycosyltransferase family A protein [Spirochaetales bacterium]
MPYFSLIIATINRMEPHLSLLKSLKEQRYSDFEIIIVDQNPHDELKKALSEELKGLKLTYLHVKESLGLSAARNLGLTHATGEVVAFPDDDCWYRPDTLVSVFKYFKGQPELECITGLVTDVDGSYSAGGYMYKSRRVNVSHRNAWFTSNSSAIFIKKDVLEEVGDFDENIGLGTERYISGEETDLVLRIHIMGHKVRYFSNIQVYHKKYRGKYDEKERQRGYGYGLGMGYVLRKNGYTILGLSFYSAMHWAKGSYMLLTLHPRRALFHFAQAWGRIRGWFEYNKS